MEWTEGLVDVSDIAAQVDDLAAQYVARVEQDLTDNAEQQELLRQEMEALSRRLEALERNRTVLVGIRAALKDGVPDPARAESSAGAKGTVTGQDADPGGAAAPKTARKPTLVDLVCSHLTSQLEPRSAAEVSTDIAEHNPDRQVKITVVRATLEALVAQGRVRRSKQGRSVFYSSTDLGREMAPVA